MPSEEMLGVASSFVKADKITHRSSGEAGFFGTTPITQGANVADATSTTTTTATTTALETDVDNLRTTVNAINARLEAYGLLASS